MAEFNDDIIKKLEQFMGSNSEILSSVMEEVKSLKEQLNTVTEQLNNVTEKQDIFTTHLNQIYNSKSIEETLGIMGDMGKSELSAQRQRHF